MITIEKASMDDLQTIHSLANVIWPVAYQQVISDSQINFMLSQSYSTEALKQQMLDGHVFYLLYNDAKPLGFASLSDTAEKKTFKLQKLYLHPTLQGKGAGKILISFIEKEAKKRGADTLILNVNRNNKAQYFYSKVGYNIIETVDIPYYNYVLNDYVMAKSLV